MLQHDELVLVLLIYVKPKAASSKKHQELVVLVGRITLTEKPALRTHDIVTAIVISCDPI